MYPTDLSVIKADTTSVINVMVVPLTFQEKNPSFYSSRAPLRVFLFRNRKTPLSAVADYSSVRFSQIESTIKNKRKDFLFFFSKRTVVKHASTVVLHNAYDTAI